MIKKLGKYIGEYWKASVITPISMILEVAMEMMLPFLMASLIDKGVEVGNLNGVLKYGAWMVGVSIISLSAGIFGGKYGAKASAGFAKNLRAGVFEHIQTFSFANIDKFQTGGLITRLTTDITNIQNSYQMLLRIAMRAPFMLIFALIMAFSINVRLSFIYVGAVLLLGTGMFILIKNAMKYFTKAFPKYDELNAGVQENVSAIRVVKAYVREDFETKKFHKASNNILEIFVKAENIVAYNMPMMYFTIFSCILLISWFGAKMIVAQTLTTGEVMGLIAYCMNILMSLMMISMVFVMVSMSIASARRVVEILEEESTLTNPEYPCVEVKDGSIRFENVEFSYSKESTKPVLTDLNFTINSGETIGILGGTGSSKTSLVSLIGRLYDVTKGVVYVGGKDVRAYDLEVLRNQVSVVLQKNVLFSGTVLDNLRWGNPEATLEECKRACQIASAHEFIEELPDGYDTYIERGGANVSGGQKQRLCIARALLKNPKVLILDDSTSAVDTATETKIREAFREYIPEITKIIIAQRISSVSEADHIILLNEGKMDGYGTHEELLANNPIYQEVYETQIGGAGDFDKEGGAE
jgi:ATP-binding cassette subfamily B protein